MNHSHKCLKSILCAGFMVLLFSIPVPSYPQKLPSFEELPVQTSLPDPFAMLDGTPVKTREDWYNKRRPELKMLFQHYIYGYLPPEPQIRTEIRKTDKDVFVGRATYREIILWLQLPGGTEYPVHLALFIPNKRTKPAPVFLALNFSGNHKLMEYDGISIIERSWIPPRYRETYRTRGNESGIWAVENTINRGFALATFAAADMDPDKHDWSDGIHASYTDPPGKPLSRWGTIAAWAWGLHRAVDYLVTDKDIDPGRICVTGWSRMGKTALFAGAMDERIALVVPHQSGTGGMALNRMNPSETVERITRTFPHWFNDFYSLFGRDVERLPVDQHLLVALVAPRPLLDDAGLQDTWASPHLALEAMKSATPVYEFLGEKGILGDGSVRDKIGNVAMGKMLQFQMDTVHQLDIHYWNAMMDFAERQLNIEP